MTAKTYHKVRRWYERLFLMLFGGVIVLTGASYTLGLPELKLDERGRGIPWLTVVGMAPFFVAWLLTRLILSSWLCPKCGLKFFGHHRLWFHVTNKPKSECDRCGVPLSELIAQEERAARPVHSARRTP